MKNYSTILGLIALIVFNWSCGSKKVETEFDEESDSVILVGKIKLEDLKTKPYKEWYDSSYADYTVDSESLTKANTAELLKSTEITIIMGTWCSDSQREVPSFIKILESLDYDMDKLNIICVNRAKEISTKGFEDIKVEFVPDFIFKQNNKDLGWIIETPEKSLEQDMIKILNK